MPNEGLQPGDIVAKKLEVIRKIGGGGMGAVYEVEHKLTKHRRALKILHKSQAMNERYVERLLREASVAGRLDTPYVVETLDAGTLEDGAPYVLMELLRGKALLDIMETEAPLDASRMVRIVLQVCEGMAAAHAAGIIHRDLKPENILVRKEADGTERVKIVDFGISHFREIEGDDSVSRLTSEGTIIGTPYYMSPEQASGHEVDERTDVYALGIILYEALTGRLPFIAETTGALFIKIGTGEYLPLRHRRRDIDPELADVVERAFHREQKQRFASTRELAEALTPYASGPVGANKPRRATADYESDPPRAETRPGVAPEAARIGAAVGREPRPKDAKAKAKEVPVVEESARPFASRDAATEELEAAALSAGPAPASARAEVADVANAPVRDSIDDLPDSDPPPRPGLPQWLGTASVAAIIAAVVAATIVAVGGLTGDDDDASPPPVVQDRAGQRVPVAELAPVVDPIEDPELDPDDESIDEGDPPEQGDERPSMMRNSRMGMQTAAEAAGLESDPYGP